MTESQQIDPNMVIETPEETDGDVTQPSEAVNEQPQLYTDVTQTPEHQRMAAAQQLYDSLVATYGDAAVDSRLTKKIILGYFGLGKNVLKAEPQNQANAIAKASSALEGAKTDAAERAQIEESLKQIVDVLHAKGQHKMADDVLASMDFTK